MGLGNLTYLLALTGVALPILIHLWSRKTPKTLPFGSVRFLQESETRTLRSIQPSELLLLLLRVGIIICLVLIVSEPWSLSTQDTNQSIVLVDPVYADRKEIAVLRDTSQASLHWLTSGLPTIDTEISGRPPANVWELASHIAQLPFEEKVVLSPRLYARFKGPANALPEGLLWQSLPARENVEEVDQVLASGRTITIETMTSEPHSQFRHTLTGSDLGRSLDVKVFVASEAETEELAQLVRTTFVAISKNGLINIEASLSLADADWVFWLKRDPAPRRNHLVLINTYERGLSRVAPYVYQLGAELTADDFLTYHIPLKIESMFTSGLIDTDPYDQRMVPIEQVAAFTSGKETAAAAFEKKSWQSVLWLVLVGTLLIERWWSLKTSQS